jgi:hypothetical protein
VAHICFVLKDDVLAQECILADQLDLCTELEESADYLLILALQGRLNRLLTLFHFDVVDEFTGYHREEFLVFLLVFASVAHLD